MKIRTKTLAVIALAVLVSAAANLLILRAVVFPGFVAQERASAERDMQRVIEAFNSTVDNLDAVVNDYAKWDTTYYFSLHNDKDYEAENITPDGLNKLRICLIGIYDKERRPLVESFFDFATNQLQPADDLSFSRVDRSGRLFAFQGIEGFAKGILPTDQGPIIAASRAILKTSGEGPIAGTFIFGKMFDAEAVEALRRQTRVDFRAIVLDGTPLPVEVQQQLGDIRQDGREIRTHEADDGALHGYALVRDIYGEPALLLTANFRRDISRVGENLVWVSVLGMMLAGAVVMAATALLLQWLVLGPLADFTRHVLAVGRSGDISRRVGLDRDDELGLLGREFDAMLENLAQARHRLLEQSYRSGIAEMASGVLHNIRNQLAPLVMQLGRLREQLATGRDDKIDRALDELGCPAVPEERKEKMARYIRMSIRADDERRSQAAEQMSALVEDFVRFRNVLQELDRFSRADCLEAARSSLDDVVRETIGMLPTFPDIRVKIRVDAALQALPPVVGPSFVLQHILHNLMINAVEAIAASGRPQGEVRISAIATSLDGRDCVELRLHDDGVGIAAETLPQIFARGFSTKQGERRGSGLHWCANRIAAIGGTITAESEGAGRGATFRLTLPVAAPAIDAAA